MVGLEALNERYSADILLYVYRHEGCIKTELYSGLGSKARLPEKIRKLDDAGLLRQDVDWSTHLYTTDKGRRVASKLAEIEEILEGSETERSNRAASPERGGRDGAATDRDIRRGRVPSTQLRPQRDHPEERFRDTEEKEMRAQTKAVIASVAVLAMLLSTAGGVTYSWFADERSVDIDTGTAKVSYEQTLTYDGSAMGSDTIVSGDTSIQHTLKVTVTNTGTVPVVYSSGFIAERYSAYTAGLDYTGGAYIGDYKMDGGSLVEDTVGTKGSYQSGAFQNSLRAFQVEVNGAFESIGTGDDGWTIRSADSDSVYGTSLGLTKGTETKTVDVKYNAWRISNDDLVLTPGGKADLTFVLAYQKTNSDGSATATYDSSHPPTVRFVSSCIQADSYAAVQMTGSDGTVTGSITVAQSHAGYVFYDGTTPEDSNTRIVIGWNAIDISDSVGKTLTVTISDVEGGKKVTVSGGCTFRTSGGISYTLDLGTGVSSVSPMDGVPMTVWKDGSNTVVSFSDSKDALTHTVGYATTSSADP